MAGTRLRFRSAAAAFAEAERMEELRDDEVRELRERGAEAAADRASDKWARQIAEVQAEGRRLEAREAKKTPQPRDTPKHVRRRAATPRKPAARSSSSGLGAVARSGYRRSGVQAQVTGWGTLAWQIAGMTIGVAILTIFVSSSRGTGAFAALANGAAGGLELFTGQVDPLAKGAVASTVENTSPTTSTATAVTSPGLAQVPKPGGRVLTGRA